ncbi:hypothetical protein [Streptomyces sp. I4(2020)]|uniref:hypothetical protein n=1 Tax=Streptomyces sp. I4(2020) TaxID=2760981 RepID=UPI0018EE59CC|nr:hypothetical protein [Streptomyces sp. I4(2020)]MBJ6615096.1 hypothetical protein [Streptomyces sp. I3(2020)]MBJ6625518.1 hypothetical protein [Streptomyces sp. I4(2020)]
MSTAFVPQQQPQHPGGTPDGPPPVPPYASEASRLLCAGTYLDAGYRDRVVEELYLHEQRVVAPSLGFDAARVLAHALRARRLEMLWAAAVVGLWIVGALVSGGLLAYFLIPSLLLAFAPLAPRAAAPLLRWSGRVITAFLLYSLGAAAFGGADGGSGYESSYESGGDNPLSAISDGLAGSAEPWQAWFGIGVLVVIGLCVAGRRDQFARVLAEELSRDRFPDAAGDRAEQSGGQRLRRLIQRIRLEQHTPLVMYHEARPFCGAGAPHDTWVLAVELRPDEDADQQPLSNRAILDRVRPLIEQLRIPAEHAGPGVRDRLRRLEVDECVFLPVEGLLRRDEAPYAPDDFEQHRTRAVEEGGEKRRHFLRVRVAGWEEELVVTVFVRVHTQGRMLMLEIAPHVLLPVRADFKDADRAYQDFRDDRTGRIAGAAVLVPRSAGEALITLGRGLRFAWRLLTGGHAHALPDGPALSARELAEAPAGSTFQDMDVARYLRSVQDRISRGVRLALGEAGYETGEFVQKIVNISSGAVHIGRADNSSFAFGDHARAQTTTGGPEPQKGSD